MISALLSHYFSSQLRVPSEGLSQLCVLLKRGHGKTPKVDEFARNPTGIDFRWRHVDETKACETEHEGLVSLEGGGRHGPASGTEKTFWSIFELQSTFWNRTFHL